jgi:AcrR family transcriptional regulator
MRADARRNRGRILDAAREQISAHSSDVSMEQIAKAAGVAVGTLYRHYPTKTDLVQAILTEYTEALLEEAEEAARSLQNPGDGHRQIVTLLEGFLQSASSNHAFKDVAAALDATHSTTQQDDRARSALGVLITAGQADGHIRPGITPDDILLIMVTAPTDLPENARRRWLQICLAGISLA